MDDDVLRVTRTCSIPLRELEWRFGPSGGPGGQHANRSNTRAELRFDIEASSTLGPRQRERLIARLGPVVRIVVDDERSQLRNRTIALERLKDRLAAGLHVDRPRRATRPTRASVNERIQSKRRRSEVKRARRRPEATD